VEAYWGAFLTDFFSFFMIVATAATLFLNGIPLVTGEQAAMAIRPFAGELAGTFFCPGYIKCRFMGVVIVGLSTTYAFSEFFGLYRQSGCFLYQGPELLLFIFSPAGNRGISIDFF